MATNDIKEHTSELNKQRTRLRWDFFCIVLSITLAAWLAYSNTISRFLEATQGMHFVESFIGGIFFTSAFTTPPAIALLGKIAQSNSAFWTALSGGLGALLGDMALFIFVKDRFSSDLMALIGKRGKEKLRHIFASRLFHWFSPFVAALVIASPLPDELGIMLLGLAKTRTILFALLSFTANFLGILAIGAIAKSIL